MCFQYTERYEILKDVTPKNNYYKNPLLSADFSLLI